MKTKPHFLLHIFHDTSLGDPAWKPLPLRGRGFHAGRLVKYHGKYATTMWFCFRVNQSHSAVDGLSVRDTVNVHSLINILCVP